MISPARADASFNYLDENGDLRQQVIAADHVIGGVWNIGSETLAGWYAVTGTLTIAHTLRVEGEAHLILTDGASLTVNATSNKAGIEVSEGDSLTVYAQSAGAGMGSLTVSGGSYCAAIGGSRGDSYQNGQPCGAVTINGGAVTANGDGTGIGGGQGSAGPQGGTGGSGGRGGVVTINGGTVTATSHKATAIGGGEGGHGSFIGVGGNGGRGGDGGTVTINGGTVTATSFYSPGIGGGSGGYIGMGDSGGAGYYGGGGGSGGIITINGGVVAASSTYTASIGGGDGIAWGPADRYGGDGGTITINGGTVTGANIGMGGVRGPAGTVEINGGFVTGRLSGGWYSAGGNVAIRGGRVNSEGIANGLYGYDGGTVAISGGTVKVGSGGIANGNGSGTVGGSVVISGGSVNVAGNLGSTPTNGSGNGNLEVALARAQLENVSLETAVENLTVKNAAYYGTNDLYTDATGILYLYLPSGASATRAQTADQTYVGSVASGATGILVPPGTDSTLSDLSLSEGLLTPAFSSGTISYTATVPYSVSGVAVTPTVTDTGNATVTVNGVAAVSGSPTGEIPLAVGGNAIEVICTAEDGVSETTYTVTVTRSGAPVITVQPSEKTVMEGKKASFSVEASGTEPLRYQWYVNRGGAKGWVAIDTPSARTATYTTSALKLKHNGYAFECLVENDAGSVRSEAATLTVIEKAAPQTGDDSSLPLWLTLMLLSGLGLALLAGRRAFRRR